MDVPYTWRPTGWFQVGWSADFPSDRAVPLRYFGEELAAYRDSGGKLHILDAHCPHFGAHIGHGGKVNGDCVTCPYHGWVWSSEGTNVSIPYQDTPNPSKRLRVWPVVEQYGSVYLWHHPKGGEVGWEMPDIFRSFPQFETDPDAYYTPMTAKASNEPVHPQVVAENGPDSVHFEYVHRATVAPVSLDWNPDGPFWKFLTGWPDVRAESSDTMALRIHSWLAGLGGSLTAFEGAQNHRLTVTVTPVEKGLSDMFYTVWWPRLPGDTNAEPPSEIKAMIDKQFLSTMEDDLEIWRYQRYVEHPALAKQDAKPYKALRKWAQQFYDIPPET
jgi:3-ketosteroid 9alpha-monooxygenase subunit A